MPVHDCTMYLYVDARGPDGPAWPHVCRGWHQLPRLPGLHAALVCKRSVSCDIPSAASYLYMYILHVQSYYLYGLVDQRRNHILTISHLSTNPQWPRRVWRIWRCRTRSGPTYSTSCSALTSLGSCKCRRPTGVGERALRRLGGEPQRLLQPAHRQLLDVVRRPQLHEVV